MAPETLALAVAGEGAKGDVRAVAEIAGVMAAKKTSELIPMCHPLALSKVEVKIEPADGGLSVTARVKTTGPTGVEMEALTAVAVAGLALIDMVKAVDPGAVLGEIMVESKTGGTSGDWHR
jgi:cyclic pyranopterin phosphate synthase